MFWRISRTANQFSQKFGINVETDLGKHRLLIIIFLIKQRRTRERKLLNNILRDFASDHLTILGAIINSITYGNKFYD